MSLLREFPAEVISSHALVVSQILAGEQPSTEIMLQLGAETLSVDKLAVLSCRTVTTIKEARSCWQSAWECFTASQELWNRLESDGELLEIHRRLLRRLCNSANDRLEFYGEVENERSSYRRRKVD
jgi:hypothetical protein